MDRDYYPIIKAAGMAKKDVEDLLHFGAVGKLPIYILGGGYPALVTVHHKDSGKGIEFIDRENDKYSIYKFPLSGLFKLTTTCLQKFETDKNLNRPEIDLSKTIEAKDHEPDVTVFCNETITLSIDKLFIKKNDMKLISSDSNQEIKPPGGVYRSTLLKFALGIAISKYSYDPTAGRNPMVGRMKADLEKTLYSLDEETINKILQEAYDHLSSKN
jgi:hypothetical protein